MKKDYVLANVLLDFLQYADLQKDCPIRLDLDHGKYEEWKTFIEEYLDQMRKGE